MGVVGATDNLERYRYLSALGTGGMSTVVLAEDTLLGRRVALKRMHTPEDVRRHSRFRREAVVGASLTHANLVSIFDVCTTEDGEDVIVMEYVEGETLAQRLRRGARLGVREALEILSGVSAALDAIHRQGIVHRDVKPANILLGIDGTVKLADLGIAAVPDRTRITTDGAVLGTFSYMAPEQLEGAVATAAVDVYALALVAFEVLSGKRARTEPNPVALAHAISTQPPPDLRAAWPDAPESAAELLKRGMARDPKARPRSAGELVARLKAAFEPQTTRPVARQSPMRQEPRTRRYPMPAAVPAAASPAAAAAATGARRASARPAAGTPPPPRGRSVPPAKPSTSSKGRRGPAVVAALALAAIAAAVILLASSGGSTRTSSTGAGSARHTSPPRSNSSSSSSAAAPAAGTGGGGSSASSSSGAPIAAVESFYHLAAAHDYSAAWALADPAFRAQLGGYPSFESGQAADRSITFDSASVLNQSATAATVYIRTTSVRANGTQHCRGPVQVAHSSSGWLLDHIDINCA